MAKETNIDCMKYRKSTHLAGVDVEMMIAEKGKCILTIKEAYYSGIEIINGKSVGVNVNGKVLEGYYIEFLEDTKPMKVNSGNRKTIASIAKIVKKISSVESRNLMSWKGLKIELYFDPDVMFSKEKTGGIKVNPISPIPDISDANALAILNSSKTKTELQANWGKLTKDEKALPSVNATKDKLKNELND